MITVKEFIDMQNAYTSQEFTTNMKECLVATTYNRIFCHAKEYKWNISSVPHTNKKKVLVILKPEKLFPELWVSSTYTRYRSAFIKYLKDYFNIDENINDFHVDHILSKKLFQNKHPEYYIRLCLIPKSINVKYGSLYEKVFSNSWEQKDVNGGFHMTYLNLTKIWGIPLPKYKSTQEEREEWSMKTAVFISKKINENSEDLFPGILLNLYDGYRNLNINKLYPLLGGYVKVFKDFS